MVNCLKFFGGSKLTENGIRDQKENVPFSRSRSLILTETNSKIYHMQIRKLKYFLNFIPYELQTLVVVSEVVVSNL